jgi:hypothetical protein
MNIKLSYYQLSCSCPNKKNDSKCNKIEELCIIIAHMDSVTIHNSLAHCSRWQRDMKTNGSYFAWLLSVIIEEGPPSHEVQLPRFFF